MQIPKALEQLRTQASTPYLMTFYNFVSVLVTK